VLADAFAAGARNLPGTKALDARLLSLSRSLQHYSENPTVSHGLDRVTLTVKSLRAPLAFLTPAQTTCNYVTLFLRNTGSSVKEPFGRGTALRFDVVVIDDVLGGEAVPSQKPYLTNSPGGSASGNNGESAPLHVNPYPNTAAPGQPHECAAGNEPFHVSAMVGNPPGNLGTKTEKTTRPKG
jgi:hypothetical protein